MKTKKSKKKLITILVIAVLLILGFGYYMWHRTTAKAQQNSSGKALDRTYTLKRGDLVLGVIASGNVNARKKHKLSLDANLRTKLIWVIDENTQVKENDSLAKFDAEDLKKEINKLILNADNLSKELDVMLEQQRIQASTDAESIRSATDRLEQAQDSLRKYRRYELRESRNSMDSKIQDAEAALLKAKNSYIEYQNTMATTSSSDSTEQAKRQQELETRKKAITTAEKALESTESSRKVFLRYDNPTKVKNLVSSLEQATLNLEKVKVSINSQALQAQRRIDNMKIQIQQNKDDLTLQESYMPMMELFAPVDGVVLYGNPDERWGRTDVKLGMDVYRGMVLMTIPDMRRLIVEFDLPEMYRSKVSVGNDVIITPDSLPNLKMKGKIDTIATLPVNVVFFDQNSPKVYKSKIELSDEAADLVNGMGVQIEIVSGIIENTLYVPVEAVQERGNDFFVYRIGLTGPEEVTVKLGRSNDAFVEITDGLNEDDVVYLYRPFQKREGDK